MATVDVKLQRVNCSQLLHAWIGLFMSQGQLYIHVSAVSAWLYLSFVLFVRFSLFYRAMHFSAKRGIAIACRLSVRPSVRLSVCDVGGL